jgi:replicative DNA helicase
MIETNAKQEISQSYQQRLNNAKNIIRTGIEYWDDCTSGIWPNDFIVLTAKSGSGKSEIASLLAQNISAQDKQVLYFALESYPGEIVDRMLYRELGKIVFNKYKRYINYKDFLKAKYDSEFLKEMKEATALTQTKREKMYVYYREGKTYIKDLMEVVERFYSTDQIKNTADLIIIDHLAYFDFDDEREYKAIKKAIRELRDLTTREKVPVILVAHLRKSNKMVKELVPDIEEIQGASEIFKEATQVITIAPHYEMNEGHRFATLFRIGKFRIEGSVKRYVGVHMFNSVFNEYEPNYNIFTTSFDEKELVPVTDLPYWAKEKIIIDNKTYEIKKHKKEVGLYDNYTDTDKD